MTIVTSVEELNALYGEPGEASLIKVTDYLLPEYRTMIEASPFIALATVGPEGLDCSPRGDAGSVIHIEDERTLMLPDWRGRQALGYRNVPDQNLCAAAYLLLRYACAQNGLYELPEFHTDLHPGKFQKNERNPDPPEMQPYFSCVLLPPANCLFLLHTV